MRCEMCKRDFQAWRCRVCPGAEVQVRLCSDCHRKVVHKEIRRAWKRSTEKNK